MRLDGAVVWVTGASSGIGEALVPVLVGGGARVAVSARRADRLVNGLMLSPELLVQLENMAAELGIKSLKDRV